jgi:hypothetical protein
MEKEFDRKRMKLIAETIKTLGGEATVNEAIQYIWDSTDNREKLKHDWRFFVHLNKFPARFEKKKIIVYTSKTKMGNTKEGKVWKLV